MRSTYALRLCAPSTPYSCSMYGVLRTVLLNVLHMYSALYCTCQCSAYVLRTYCALSRMCGSSKNVRASCAEGNFFNLFYSDFLHFEKKNPLYSDHITLNAYQTLIIFVDCSSLHQINLTKKNDFVSYTSEHYDGIELSGVEFGGWIATS